MHEFRKCVQRYQGEYKVKSFSTALGYYAEWLQPKRAVQIVATMKKPMSKGKLQMEGPFETLSSVML